MPVKITRIPAPALAPAPAHYPAPAHDRAGEVPAPDDDLIHLRGSVRERRAAGLNSQMPGPLCRPGEGPRFETLMSSRVTCPICRERLEGLTEGDPALYAPQSQTVGKEPPEAPPVAPKMPKKCKPSIPAPLAENDERNF